MKSALKSILRLLLVLPMAIKAVTVTNLPARMANDYSLFIGSDGSLWGVGYNADGELGDSGSEATYETNQWEQIVSSNVVAVAGGADHTLSLKSDGSLWGMGNIQFGELGDGFDGTVYPYGSVFPEQLVPRPQPLIIPNIASKTNLQLKATTPFGGTFYLLMGTNLSQLQGQGTKIRTNVITTRGTNNFTATITNAAHSGPSQQFYILQSP